MGREGVGHMLGRLAIFILRHRNRVLGVTALILIAAALLGGHVSSKLSSGGYDSPGSESAKTQAILEHQFGQQTPNLVLVIKTSAPISSAANLAAGLSLEHRLAKQQDIAQVAGYFSTHSPAMLSRNGHEALVLAYISGTEEEATARAGVLNKELTSNDPSFSVGVAGFSAIFSQVNSTIAHDVQVAEYIAIPVTFLALTAVFGGLVAASLPLVVGVTAILTTYLYLRVLVIFTPVSVYSLNITTALGLGLGIDYSLFIVSRYREELRKGKGPKGALIRTMETAGRTVIFSGLTVALSLSALLVFPLFFLRSFAYAGIVVVLSAVAGAVVVLPAVIALLGTRVDRLVLWKRKPKPDGPNVWFRIARVVMARPIHIGALTIIFLLALGVPFLSAKFGLPDDRILPKTSSTHVVTQAIRDDFSQQDENSITVVGTHLPKTVTRARVDEYAHTLRAVPGVAQVATVINNAGVRITVVPSVEAYSTAGVTLVHDLRAVPAPFHVGLTGNGPQFVDVQKAVFSKLPLALGLIAIATFVLLFLLTGSFVLPIKALLLNLISLSAVFGALVWVFQEGHLGSLIGGFQISGYLDITTPVLLFCVAFGTSMDYEVFLMSRIKEEHDLSGDTQGAVAMGLSRTGGIVTSAAALFAIVNIAFVTSGVTFIKLFGVGLTIAVMVDATLIRGLLVPAFMRLMGEANWWAPPWARRIHERWGMSDEEIFSLAPPPPRAAKKAPQLTH